MKQRLFSGIALGVILFISSSYRPTRSSVSDPAPALLPLRFGKLPVTSFAPSGWLRKQLELQRDGLTGHLGEISVWLSKADNAWLNKSGKGTWGWEELPYWLKGYADIGYMLRDTHMIAEARSWIEAVLRNQRPNGDFGPDVRKKGNRDLWTNMPMLWCLQSYYEYTQDARVLRFMEKYFRFELSVPETQFLKDYWENSRGGDNLLSVYWLYEKIHAPWLLGLATKIDRNTANWRQANDLPNWHNVNIAQSFREPATYYRQSRKPEDLAATYRDFRLVREKYGQVPGGLWGGDENSRPGYDDPRQAVETCGMVEQMTSDEFLLQITGDAMWADNCEDVAFNTFPAAFMPDYRSLRYLTAPNMVVSDSMNHAPGIGNEGPFLMMNPFSSRCCQHNHAAGWVYFAENSWMATPDSGLVNLLYAPGRVTTRLKQGATISVATNTHYPFSSAIDYTVDVSASVHAPLWFRVPAWCAQPSFSVNGETIAAAPREGYVRIDRVWASGDRIALRFPMKLAVRTWTRNKNSVSVNYGPLTYSLHIGERLAQQDSRKTAVWDARWQKNADPAKWPAFEIFPTTPWNYGLLVDTAHPETSFEVREKTWPADDNPFADSAAPLEMRAKGKQLPDWTLDRYGLCAVLPQSPVASAEPLHELLLVPMGGARLRISAFPVVAPEAAQDPHTFTNPLLPSGADPYNFFKDGFYYYTNSLGDRIDLWKTRDITDLAHAERKTIFHAVPNTGYARDLWAPEVMFLRGKWYAYFAADRDGNASHRLWVLENPSPDPMQGEWTMKGQITDRTNKWAIDGDVFEFRGKLYMIWSGWEGDVNGRQDIYIARLKNPWTVESKRVRISQPEFPWEKYGDLHDPKEPPHLDVNEGPQALQHEGRLFVVYSASACWTDTYALGLLRFSGQGDPLDAKQWTKSPEPVFQQSPERGVYATGHNSFFRSPDGREDWLLYHANAHAGDGCGAKRAPRAQPFVWSAGGDPVFGEPLRDGMPLRKPSGTPISNN